MRRERRRRSRRVKKAAVVILHHLGDTEIEELDPCVGSARLTEHEHVLGLDVAVRDVLAVGRVEREHHRLEQLDRLLE